MKLLRKCPTTVFYTLKESCPHCGQATISPKPPKYSPEDRYAKYRQIGRRRTEANKST